PFERHPPTLAHGLDGLELSVRQRAGVVKQTADQRRFPVIDMAHNDDAKLLADRIRDRGGAARHHIYPAARSRSKASSVSRSIARPARSGARVTSSSMMIASRVLASLSIGKVMSLSPSER